MGLGCRAGIGGRTARCARGHRPPLLRGWEPGRAASFERLRGVRAGVRPPHHLRCARRSRWRRSLGVLDAAVQTDLLREEIDRPLRVRPCARASGGARRPVPHPRCQPALAHRRTTGAGRPGAPRRDRLPLRRRTSGRRRRRRCAGARSPPATMPCDAPRSRRRLATSGRRSRRSTACRSDARPPLPAPRARSADTLNALVLRPTRHSVLWLRGRGHRSSTPGTRNARSPPCKGTGTSCAHDRPTPSSSAILDDLLDLLGPADSALRASALGRRAAPVQNIAWSLHRTDDFRLADEAVAMARRTGRLRGAHLHAALAVAPRDRNPRTPPGCSATPHEVVARRSRRADPAPWDRTFAKRLLTSWRCCGSGVVRLPTRNSRLEIVAAEAEPQRAPPGRSSGALQLRSALATASGQFADGTAPRREAASHRSGTATSWSVQLSHIAQSLIGCVEVGPTRTGHRRARGHARRRSDFDMPGYRAMRARVLAEAGLAGRGGGPTSSASSTTCRPTRDLQR